MHSESVPVLDTMTIVVLVAAEVDGDIVCIEYAISFYIVSWVRGRGNTT